LSNKTTENESLAFILTFFHHYTNILISKSKSKSKSKNMGAAASLQASQSVGGVLNQAQEGAKGPSQSQVAEQKRREARAKTQQDDFNAKKKAREERKKKLAAQWSAHREANS
jgi:hypothetical protein